MRMSSPLRGLWAIVLLMLGLLTSAVAQNSGDAGNFEILSARFGTAERNVDVTPRLKDLARQDQNFRVNPDTLRSDPHPGQKKTLRIFARGRDGKTQTFDYAEDSQVNGAWFTGWSGGNWGGDSGNSHWNGHGNAQPGGGGYPGNAGNAGGDRGEYQILQASFGTSERHVDVTQRLKELASQDRSVRLGGNTFGADPAPGQRKTLRIFTRARSGYERSFEYAEDSTVDGALFIGWGGGQWGQGGWNGGWGENQHPGANNSGYGSNNGRGGHLLIVNASYGTEDQQRNITYRVRSRVQNERLSVRADNDLAGGDPAPERPKTLWITYTLGGGAEQRVRVRENDRVNLP